MDCSTIAHLTEADRAGLGDGRASPQGAYLFSPEKSHSTFDFHLNRTVFHETLRSHFKTGLNLFVPG